MNENIEQKLQTSNHLNIKKLPYILKSPSNADIK
jgi:hypothetical protein